MSWPWSEAPWCEGTYVDGETVIYERDGALGASVVARVPGPFDSADAALIALAPELAEAVIEVGDYLARCGNCHGNREQRVIALRDRLREIEVPA